MNDCTVIYTLKDGSTIVQKFHTSSPKAAMEKIVKFGRNYDSDYISTGKEIVSFQLNYNF